MMSTLNLRVSCLRTILWAAACVSMAACSSAPEQENSDAHDPLKPQKERVVKPFDEQARRGGTRERTLYPHHFVVDAAELNDLGRAQLSTMVEQLPERGGRIHLSPGAASSDLGKQRLQAVADQLKVLGVATERVSVAVGHPGGSGAAAVEVLDIREKIAGNPMDVPNPIAAPDSGRMQ